MTEIILQLCLGIVLGYIGATVSESLLHRYILHAPPAFVNYWKKHPRFFKTLIREHYIHHVHHTHTFKKDHVTQFMSKAEQKHLDEYINTYNTEWANHIRKTGYGLFAQVRGLIYVAILTTLVFEVPFYFLFGGWACLGSAPFMYFLSYFMSRHVHPFTHDSYEKCMRNNSKAMRLLLRTAYFRCVIRYHYLHHKYIHCNYNLALGADYFWGWGRKKTEKDKTDMQKIGIQV